MVLYLLRHHIICPLIHLYSSKECSHSHPPASEHTVANALLPTPCQKILCPPHPPFHHTSRYHVERSAFPPLFFKWRPTMLMPLFCPLTSQCSHRNVQPFGTRQIWGGDLIVCKLIPPMCCLQNTLRQLNDLRRTVNLRQGVTLTRQLYIHLKIMDVISVQTLPSHGRGRT